MKKISIICVTVFLLLGIMVSAGKSDVAQGATTHFEKIGPQIFNTNAITGVAGYAPDGTALMYVLLQGEPAKLVVMDIVQNKVWDQKTLAQSTSAWAISVDAQQNVWIGGTPDGHLFKYLPKTKTLTDLGKSNPRITSIHDLETTSAGVVYGSTSPDGSVFRYETGKGFKDLGQVLPGKTLGKSLAYNEQTNTLFVGLGAKAQLVAWNLSTNKKQSILPKEYQGQTSIYDLDEENGYLFAKLDPSKKILVFDSRSYAFIKELPASSRGVSSINPEENAVYYSHQYLLYKYNLETGKSNPVNGNLNGTEAVSMDVIDLHHQEYPGLSVVGLLGNTGTFLIYNSKMGRPLLMKLNIPPQPIPIYNVEKGTSGLIYSNGFVSGKLTAYNPKTKETKQLLNVGQAESMTFLGGNLYLGVYPGAYLHKYNPASMELEKLFAIGNGQERIVAMVGDSPSNNLFMGTHPKNGEVAGTLTIYNPKTKKLVVRRNIIPEQSVISLTGSDGYIYGGTSIFGNGANPEKNSAVLFRIKASDPNGKIERIPLPIKKPRMIHSLAAGKSGVIWGLSDGNLFAYDSKKKTFKTINITPNTSGRFKNGSLIIGQNGIIYGTVEEKLFSVDPNTMKKTIYSGYKADDVTMGDDGNLYFSAGPDLWVFKVK